MTRKHYVTRSDWERAYTGDGAFTCGAPISYECSSAAFVSTRLRRGERCQYCTTLNLHDETNCPNCGAPY